MKKPIIKVIAILLLLCLFPLSLFSCSSADSSQGSDTLEGSEAGNPEVTPGTTPTEKPETPKETDPEGKITVFKNGAYVARLVRAELSSDNDKTFYNRIKAAFKDVTGKAAKTSTDFVSSGGTLDDSSAILIGSTAYEESKSTIASLKNAQAVAKIVNNKYVIAYSNSESLLLLLKELEKKIAAQSAEEIVIDSSWNITVQGTPLEESIKLPSVGDKALGTAIDIGQGSQMYRVNNVSRADYDSYVNSLITLGFHAYASNVIGNNYYGTFITETQIINVMFFNSLSEIRITQDNREKIDLPGTEAENVYIKKGTPSFTMMGISDAGYPGGMSFIYKLADGTFFIIDGGMCADREGSYECDGDPSVNRLYKTLRELADDPNDIVISGWLITHIHNDHAGAFIDLAEKSAYLKHITIKKVIYSQPCDSDMTDGWMPERLNWMPNALAKMGIEKTVKAYPGQVFYFADLKLTILGSLDLVKPAKIGRHNNASTVSMVEFGGKKALYTADAEGDMNQMLKDIYGNELDADILQVAHHGYNNTNAGIVYQYVTPSIVLWPIQTSDWKSGANVFNVGFNQTYLNKTGITHYCAGAANITFDNFTTWKATRTDWKPA